MHIYIVLFLQLVTILCGMNILSDYSIERKTFLIWLSIISIFGCLLFNVLGIWTIFLIIIFLIICLSIKVDKIFLSIIVTCFPLLLLVIGVYIAQVIEASMIRDLFSSLNILYDFSLLVTSISSIFTILVCYGLKYIFNRMQVFKLIEKRYQILMVMFLIFTLVIFYVNIFIGEQQGFSEANIRTNSILFFIYAGLIFMVYLGIVFIAAKDSKMEQERIQSQQLQEYTSQIEQLYNNLSSFRHDYLNILVSLEEGLRQEDIYLVKSVYERVVKPTERVMKSNEYMLSKLRNLQVTEIKSLLAAKLIKAQSENISVSVEIEEVIGNINMDVVEFYRVFSILIDNAIEAAIKAPKPYLAIAFIQDEEVQRVEIENSCEDYPMNLDDLYKKGYSSKGKGRGIGLYNVREILDANKYATLETYYESGVFIQTLILKKRGI
ncbi:MAG: sensor histidine kinase [Turicibacter sp.]